MDRKTILVLEDDSRVRTFLGSFFRKANYEVIESEDAQAIADKIRAGEIKYDVLISDCCSNEGGSYSENPAIMASKEFYPKIPRIGISCWPQIDAVDVHVHLPKPFQPKSLVDVLDNLLLR